MLNAVGEYLLWIFFNIDAPSCVGLMALADCALLAALMETKYGQGRY